MEIEFIKEKISKLILDLKDLVYEDEKEIRHYKILKTDEKIENFSETETEKTGKILTVVRFGEDIGNIIF